MILLYKFNRYFKNLWFVRLSLNKLGPGLFNKIFAFHDSVRASFDNFSGEKAAT